LTKTTGEGRISGQREGSHAAKRGVSRGRVTTLKMERGKEGEVSRGMLLKKSVGVRQRSRRGDHRNKGKATLDSRGKKKRLLGETGLNVLVDLMWKKGVLTAGEQRVDP